MCTLISYENEETHSFQKYLLRCAVSNFFIERKLSKVECLKISMTGNYKKRVENSLLCLNNVMGIFRN